MMRARRKYSFSHCPANRCALKHIMAPAVETTYFSPIFLGLILFASIGSLLLSERNGHSLIDICLPPFLLSWFGHSGDLHIKLIILFFCLLSRWLLSQRFLMNTYSTSMRPSWLYDFWTFMVLCASTFILSQFEVGSANAFDGLSIIDMFIIYIIIWRSERDGLTSLTITTGLSISLLLMVMFVLNSVLQRFGGIDASMMIESSEIYGVLSHRFQAVEPVVLGVIFLSTLHGIILIQRLLNFEHRPKGGDAAFAALAVMLWLPFSWGTWAVLTLLCILSGALVGRRFPQIRLWHGRRFVMLLSIVFSFVLFNKILGDFGIDWLEALMAAWCSTWFLTRHRHGNYMRALSHLLLSFICGYTLTVFSSAKDVGYRSTASATNFHRFVVKTKAEMLGQQYDNTQKTSSEAQTFITPDILNAIDCGRREQCTEVSFTNEKHQARSLFAYTFAENNILFVRPFSQSRFGISVPADAPLVDIMTAFALAEDADAQFIRWGTGDLSFLQTTVFEVRATTGSTYMMSKSVLPTSFNHRMFSLMQLPPQSQIDAHLPVSLRIYMSSKDRAAYWSWFEQHVLQNDGHNDKEISEHIIGDAAQLIADWTHQCRLKKDCRLTLNILDKLLTANGVDIEQHAGATEDQFGTPRGAQVKLSEWLNFSVDFQQASVDRSFQISSTAIQKERPQSQYVLVYDKSPKGLLYATAFLRGFMSSEEYVGPYIRLLKLPLGCRMPPRHTWSLFDSTIDFGQHMCPEIQHTLHDHLSHTLRSLSNISGAFSLIDLSHKQHIHDSGARE